MFISDTLLPTRVDPFCGEWTVPEFDFSVVINPGFHAQVELFQPLIPNPQNVLL